MTDKPPPGRAPAAEAARHARQEREAAALRANLHRRKAQARLVRAGAPLGSDADIAEASGADDGTLPDPGRSG